MINEQKAGKQFKKYSERSDMSPVENKKQMNDSGMLYRDEFGRYRWTYEMVSAENRSYLNTLLLIFALVILIPGMILFFMIYGRDLSSGHWGDAGGYLGILFLIFAAAELLTVGIYKLADKARGGSKPIPYAMDDRCIMLYPEDRKTPRAYLQTFYSSVNDIRVKPEYDEIDLMEVMRVTQVYVYPEDLPFVLGYLFDHLKQTDKILQRREEYLKYLEEE